MNLKKLKFVWIPIIIGIIAFILNFLILWFVWITQYYNIFWLYFLSPLVLFILGLILSLKLTTNVNSW